MVGVLRDWFLKVGVFTGLDPNRIKTYSGSTSCVEGTGRFLAPPDLQIKIGDYVLVNGSRGIDRLVKTGSIFGD